MEPEYVADSEQRALELLAEIWERQGHPRERLKLIAVLRRTLDRCERLGYGYPKIFLLRKGELTRGEWQPRQPDPDAPLVRRECQSAGASGDPRREMIQQWNETADASCSRAGKLDRLNNRCVNSGPRFEAVEMRVTEQHCRVGASGSTLEAKDILTPAQLAKRLQVRGELDLRVNSRSRPIRGPAVAGPESRKISALLLARCSRVVAHQWKHILT